MKKVKDINMGNNNTLQTASQKLAEIKNKQAAAQEAARLAQEELATAETELLVASRKEQAELIRTFPALLGVETLGQVGALVAIMAKEGNLDSVKSATVSERKERVILTLIQKLAVCARRRHGDTMAALAEANNVSIGTINNICGVDSQKALIAEAKESKVQIPAELMPGWKSAEEIGKGNAVPAGKK